VFTNKEKRSKISQMNTANNFENNSSQAVVANFFAPDMARVLAELAPKTMPLVQVDVITDIKIAEQVYAAQAEELNSIMTYRETSTPRNPTEWAKTARTSIEGGKVLVRFTRNDGIRFIGHLTQAAREVLPSPDVI
jgi:hypothetical protein